MVAACSRPSAPAAGGIFKSAAVEVLRRTRRLMTTGEICRLALDWGLLTCSGKTPEATMASAMYGDIKRKDRHSVFIRPQEGMFGLRAWVDQGLIPHGQHYTSAHTATTALPTQSAALPITAVTPTKRGIHSAAPTPCSGSSRGATQPKKVRRMRGSDGEAEGWRSGDNRHCDSDQQDHSDDGLPVVQEPKLYSLRRGPVGRLQEVLAAATATEGTANKQMPEATTHRGAAHDGGRPAQRGPTTDLEPLELPNLRSPAVESSWMQVARGICRRSSSSSGCSLLSPPLYTILQSPQINPPTAQAGGGGHVASILSPCSALPELKSPLAGLSVMASLATPQVFASLFSPPGSQAVIGRMQHTAHSCSSSQQRQTVGALKGAAGAAAAAGTEGASSAPATRRAAPGTAVSAMVPIDASAGNKELLPILPLEQLDFSAQLGLVAQLGSNPGFDAASLGLVAGATAKAPASGAAATTGAPEVIFKPMLLESGLSTASAGGTDGAAVAVRAADAACWPILSMRAALQLPAAALAVPSSVLPAALDTSGDLAASKGAEQPSAAGEVVAATGAPGAGVGSSGQETPGEGSEARHGGHRDGGYLEGGDGSGAADIAQKIGEVEGKVRAVEERWGPLSLKTGKAYFLLHHACRHPQAAPLFRDKADHALQRATSIVQHVGQWRLVDCQDEEFTGLLDGIRAAAAAWGGIK